MRMDVKRGVDGGDSVSDGNHSMSYCKQQCHGNKCQLPYSYSALQVLCAYTGMYVLRTLVHCIASHVMDHRNGISHLLQGITALGKSGWAAAAGGGAHAGAIFLVPAQRQLEGRTAFFRNRAAASELFLKNARGPSVSFATDHSISTQTCVNWTLGATQRHHGGYQADFSTLQGAGPGSYLILAFASAHRGVADGGS
jgi:hypothetical protein